MLGILFSPHQTAARAPVPNLRTVNKLAAALAGLPAPWRVLRNRRASAADGPPWVKYVALHPEKGIALLDLLPANPHAAVAPLDEFLARTGFAAFSHGDPPIVALALAERDIAAVNDHLADAFADAPRCGIKNANWTEAVVELLMSTSGLFLTPVERASDAPKRDSASAVAAQKATASEQPAKPAPSPPPSEALPPGTALPNDSMRPAESGRSQEPNVVFLKAPDPDLRVGRATDFERHNGRRRRPIALLLVAASLSAVAIFAVLYVRSPGTPPATMANIEHAPVLPAELPTLPADSAIADTDKPATAPPATAAVQPSAVAAPLQRPATTQTHAAVAGPPSLPDVRTRESTAIPKPVKVQPAPAVGGPAASREHSVKEAQTKLVLSPPGIDDRAAGGDLARPPANEETITVDGTTYIKGREPRALGTVTEPEPEPGFEPDN
jgi:hypothetical protein